MRGLQHRSRPPRQPGETLAATVAAEGIVQLPTAAIVVAIPTIHAEFDASIAELQWTVTAFYTPFASLLIAAGRIATYSVAAALSSPARDCSPPARWPLPSRPTSRC